MLRFLLELVRRVGAAVLGEEGPGDVEGLVVCAVCGAAAAGTGGLADSGVELARPLMR